MLHKKHQLVHQKQNIHYLISVRGKDMLLFLLEFLLVFRPNHLQQRGHAVPTAGVSRRGQPKHDEHRRHRRRGRPHHRGAGARRKLFLPALAGAPAQTRGCCASAWRRREHGGALDAPLPAPPSWLAAAWGLNYFERPMPHDVRSATGGGRR